MLCQWKKLLIDPKPTNKDFYKDAFLVTPNKKEAEELCGRRLDTDQEVLVYGKQLLSELNSNLLITRGERGMSLLEKNGASVHIPTKAREVFDVSGAGDTVIATLALSLAAGASLSESAQIANHAAGIVVDKIGTATTTQEELSSVFETENKKIKNLAELKKAVDVLKAKGKKIVFTNGCFHILHSGHVELLKKARSFGDVLIVGLNTDASSRKLKGKDRPILKQDERAEIMSA